LARDHPPFVYLRARFAWFWRIAPFDRTGGVFEGLGDTGSARMSWGAKRPSVADHAIIELRRISDILQVEHASLFLRDPASPHAAVHVAETGRPLRAALAEHATVVGRVLRTGRVQELEPRSAPDGATGAALAMPLERDDETFGVLLVVSLRRNRRLGATDARVLGRATETLVERVLHAASRDPGVASDRFTRLVPTRPRRNQ
jgi:GAF domain-containing protein